MLTLLKLNVVLKCLRTLKNLNITGHLPDAIGQLEALVELYKHIPVIFIHIHFILLLESSVGQSYMDQYPKQ